MLKRVVTAAVGVVGLVLVGLGVASATLWRADDVLVATASTGAHTYVTDPGVLELGGDPATIRVTAPGGGHVVLAVGRDTDVAGWVGTDAHARVTGLSGWRTLDVASVPAKPAPAATSGATPTPGAPAPTATPATDASTATTVADPTGSDLWVVQATGSGSATLEWPAQPGRWSLIAVGVGPESPTLSISWPRVVTTPWLWPLVVIGSLVFLAALFAFLWQERRRHRGDEASWVPVTTGMVPAVGAQDTVPLTRRQLREAAQAREGRPLTGSVPAVAHAATPDAATPDAATPDAATPDAAIGRAEPSAATPSPQDTVPAASPASPASQRATATRLGESAVGSGPATPARVGERDQPQRDEPAPTPASSSPTPASPAPTPASPAPAPASSAPAPASSATAPVTAPTSRRALRAAGALTGAIPITPAGADAAPATVPAGRPAWVPTSSSAAPEVDAAARRAHPRWLGAGDVVAAGVDVEGDAVSDAQDEPGAASRDEPGAAPQDEQSRGSGSRADAWRRAWGLPPLETDDAAERGEGRHGR